MEGILEEPLVLGADSSISKAVSQMLEHGKYEAAVMKDGIFLGVLSSADLVKAAPTNPSERTIESFVRQEKPIKYGADTSEVLNTILINDCMSFPVDKDGKIYMVSKLGLLGFLRKELNMGDRSIGDVMNFPYTLSPDDNIGSARAIMRDMNVCRLVVIDKGGRAEGVVDTLVMLRTIISKERASMSFDGDEKIKLEDFPVKSLETKVFTKAEPDSPLADAVGQMIESGIPEIIVESDGKFAGMVTVKDILKLVGKEVSGVRVTVSGIHDEDDFVKTAVHGEIENAVKKLGKTIPLSYLVLHVRKYSKGGTRSKYSVHGRLITERGDFFADDFDWDLMKAVKGVLVIFEREVKRKHEKMISHKDYF